MKFLLYNNLAALPPDHCKVLIKKEKLLISQQLKKSENLRMRGYRASGFVQFI